MDPVIATISAGTALFLAFLLFEGLRLKRRDERRGR
jgi:hypothetical protein